MGDQVQQGNFAPFVSGDLNGRLIETDLIENQPALQHRQEGYPHEDPLGGDHGTALVRLQQGKVSEGDPHDPAHVKLRLSYSNLQLGSLLHLTDKETTKFADLNQMVKGEKDDSKKKD
jgi:hypothetical protein